ncbi:piwi-like protein Siwi [Cephus cinctus]|uniref:Piwi-like protein Siwi n=1 Tax=Cephus cinctus TaxID=211228 RepID=A0AAJ7RJI2_CEPCN|nr:piwi-like protein Siwi [Cephus cinctus]XP_024942069.1 piwi-like protein Siwi [Cephus cinctus]XP_024942074.1 piwi-like protein Siwi [Cephus cinctus]XP_024942078.1 piwi-like protein Siwi [Cephus cinctus]
MADEFTLNAWGRGRGRGRKQTQAQDNPGTNGVSKHVQGERGIRPGAQAEEPSYARPSGSCPQQPQEQAQPQPQLQGQWSRPLLRGMSNSLPSAIGTSRPVDIERAVSVGRGSSRSRVVAENISFGRRETRGQAPLSVTKPSNLISKKGTSGHPLELTTNYFELICKSDWHLYQYHVDFSPEEDRIAVRKGLLRLHEDKLNGYIFDGSSLFTSHPLQKLLEFTSTRKSDETRIKITIRFVGDVERGSPTYIQVFNVLMRKFLQHLKLQLIGRDYYDAKAKIQITEYMLDLWPGYITAIKQHDHGILLCAEISHKVMRQQSIWNLLEDARRRNGGDYRARFLAEVIGMTVLTSYNNKTYRVDDVVFDLTPESTFKLRNGESISYIDYYRTKYQIKIKERYQPLLLSQSKMKNRQIGEKDIIYLVPELCRATGLTDEMRNNFRLMKSLANYTRIGPHARIQKLMSFNQRLHSEPAVAQDLKKWDLNLDKRLLSIQGRVLNQENIFFGRNKRIISGNEADWSKGFRGNHLLVTTQLNNWHYVGPSFVKRDADRFIENLIKASSPMGFIVKPPTFHDVRNENAGSYVDTLERIMRSFQPQLVLCAVPNNRADRYSAIKKKCCIDRPVSNQVILTKNLNPEKGAMSIATKIAIQLNCKLGGVPWSVEIPRSGLMVAGFDVCHDTIHRNKDIGAMVASLDKSFGRYYSAVTMHKNGEEMSNNLSTNMVDAAIKYREVNKELPTHIVLYRDGVSDGEIPYVYSHEVRTIREKLNALYKNTNPVKLAVIIVTKRINTRLFLDHSLNPPPGTIVDDGITDPLRYDFFIVSQHTRQGSVAPTHYNVIYDTLGFDADKIQRLTYKLCHMYFNWAGTVSVPAPCQYAHKLAFLVGQHLHQQPSTALENLLYFL